MKDLKNRQPGASATCKDGVHEQCTPSPNGRISIGSTASFGRHVIAPLLGKFVRAYPNIELELSLDDRPLEADTRQFDVVFRNGMIADSRTISRQLSPTEMALVAAPSYFDVHGFPETPDDLVNHKAVNFRLWNGELLEWQFNVDGSPRQYLAAGALTFNDVDLVLQAVLNGAGMAQLPACQVAEYVRSNRLVIALSKYAPQDAGHYFCYERRQNLPAHVQAFMAFITDEFRAP